MSTLILIPLLLAAEGGLSALEARLLGAEQLELEFTVHSSGAFSAELRGQLQMRADGWLHMEAAGSFGEEKAQLVWEGDAQRCRGLRDGELIFDVEAPKLAESVLLGLTRMGILHNLARFFMAGPPDHADSGIGDWLAIQNESSQVDTLRFDLDVAGQRAATVRLQLDESGLPQQRQQRVEFQSGSMEVREDYRFQVVEKPAGD